MIIVLQVYNRKIIFICENQNKVEGRKCELLLTRMALISGQTLVNGLFKSAFDFNFAIILTLRKAIIWQDYWYIWEWNVRHVGGNYEIYRYFLCKNNNIRLISFWIPVLDKFTTVWVVALTPTLGSKGVTDNC